MVAVSFYLFAFIGIVIYKLKTANNSINKVGVNNSFEIYLPETARELLNIGDN